MGLYHAAAGGDVKEWREEGWRWGKGRGRERERGRERCGTGSRTSTATTSEKKVWKAKERGSTSRKMTPASAMCNPTMPPTT